MTYWSIGMLVAAILIVIILTAYFLGASLIEWFINLFED